MDIQVGYLKLLKVATNFTLHRIKQYFLKTNETVFVDTNYGKVKGIKRRNIIDGEEPYCAFEGIPFAKPPVGDLKFRAPEPPEPWEGIRDCTSCQNKPMQRNLVTHYVEGSEDCLYLNVYVKKLNARKLLPVMVWIHGGGYLVGEASRDLYAPDYFMTKDVVLVSITYRLGPLGFLTFDDPDIGVPGNAGLKDQIMALRWIKENISHFNGDNENITVFGESAGSGTTHIMMLSDATKGLFHKAILQSGTVHCSWAFPKQIQWAYRLAKALGYTGSNNDKEVFNFLSKVDSKKLYSINSFLTREEQCTFQVIVFGPVIEPYVTKDCVISEPIEVLLKESWGKDIPLILGGNSFEGLYNYHDVLLQPYILDELGDCRRCVQYYTREKYTEEEIKQLGLKIKKIFFGQKEPSLKETLYPYLDLYSYTFIWHGVYRTLKSRLQHSTDVPTYLYRFDFDSPSFNHFRNLRCGKGIRGVCHADELSYLFHNMNASKLPKDSSEFKTIERMIDMWTSFAATSDPNCKSIHPAKWEPAHADDVFIKCLNISEEVKFINFPEAHKLSISDEI